MAVQKSKKSHSRKGMRRSHARMSAPALTQTVNGIVHRRHHIAIDGSYRGKQFFIMESDSAQAANTQHANPDHHHVHDENCKHGHDHSAKAESQVTDKNS